MSSYRPFFLRAAVAAAFVLLPACGGGGSQASSPPTTAPKATPTPALTPTPTPTLQRLYTSALVTAGPISYFTAPFSNASLPTSSFLTSALGEPGGIAIGPTGDVLHSDVNNLTITSNSRPSPTSTVQFVINPPNNPSYTPLGLAFSPTGTLFVANVSGATIDAVSAPLSAASTITPVVATGLAHPNGICFDAAGNLYDADSGAFLAVYAPPYTGAPIIVNTGAQPDYSVAYDAVTNQIAVAQGKGFGSVLIYNLPVTAASSAAATYTYSTATTQAVAFDRTGNLYVSVGTATTNSIDVYAPPFVTSTDPVPTVSFASPSVGATPEPVFSMAFGT